MDDERLDDRVADEIRARLMQQVVHDRARSDRSARAAAPRRRWAVPVLTTVVVAVVVVAVSIAVLLTPRAPQPATPFEDLPRMFGGSCGAVLPTATVADVVGGAVGKPVNVTRAQATAADAAVTALYEIGGLRCDWGSVAGGKDQSGLVVAVAPVALAPAKPTATACFPSSIGGPDQETCTFSRRSHGVWFTGSLTTATAGEAATRAALTRLGTAFAAAAAEPDVIIPLRPRVTRSWARGVDCAALVRRADLATALHLPGLVGEPGNGASEQPEAQTAAARRLGVTPCIVQWDAGNFDLTVLPGGADIRSLVAADPTATRLRLPGGRTATITKDADGVTVVHAFDGVNALQVLPDQRSTAEIAAAIPPLLRALDRTRPR